MFNSCIYNGNVIHKRFKPKEHFFKYKVFSLFIDLSELNELNSQQQMMVLDFITYLPNDILVKVDRAAMANSLETRLPMLDHNVVELALQIPMNLKLKNKVGKWILREILYKYVPKDLVERPKMGFGIPLASWLRGPLKDWAGDLLSQNTIKNQNYLE